MAIEKYEYPASGAVTNSWLPPDNPLVDGFAEELEEGIISDQSSGKKQYNYKEAIKIKLHKRFYDLQPQSERTSYESFRDAVGGDSFKFTDFNGAAHTVTFAEFTRRFLLRDGSFWAWEITMREEL